MNFALSVVRTMSGIALKLATNAARAKGEIHFQPQIFAYETQMKSKKTLGFIGGNKVFP